MSIDTFVAHQARLDAAGPYPLWQHPTKQKPMHCCTGFTNGGQESSYTFSTATPPMYERSTSGTVIEPSAFW